MAVTLPASTVATEAFELAQVMVFWDALDGSTVAVNWTVSPIIISAVD